MKALLAMAPKLPQASDLEPFSQCLDFLKQEYNITWIDPLEIYKNLTYDEYTEYWKQKIGNWVNDYDVFMGFSLGAILLQNSLPQFYNRNKIIILFSPPSIKDAVLKEKLSSVQNISLSGRTEQALKELQQYVHREPQDNFEIIPLEPWSDIESRLQYGLGYVLNYELPENVKTSKTQVYQLVGEKSQLVTKNNVYKTPKTILQVVPHAGNRILEDNPSFTQALIKEWLHVK